MEGVNVPKVTSNYGYNNNNWQLREEKVHCLLIQGQKSRPISSHELLGSTKDKEIVTDTNFIGFRFRTIQSFDTLPHHPGSIHRDLMGD